MKDLRKVIPSTLRGRKALLERVAEVAVKACEHRQAFIWATVSVLLWAATGPHFNYSDTWQLIANTTTTLVTYVLGFLIMNQAARNGKAIQLKLDELIRSIDAANNYLIGLEDKGEEEIEEVASSVRSNNNG